MVKVKIVAIEPFTRLDVTGQLRKFYRIYFVIDDRIPDWIVISETELDPESVMEEIKEIVKKIGALLKLDVSKIEIEVEKELRSVPPLMPP